MLDVVRWNTTMFKRQSLSSVFPIAVAVIATTLVTIAIIGNGNKVSLNNFEAGQTEKTSCDFNEIYSEDNGMPNSASPRDIVRYHQWNNYGACKKFDYMGGKWYNKTNSYDGHKAVCMDEKVKPVPGNCLVYSFGVRDDWTYDTALAEYGCEVHSFDPSIDTPQQDPTKKQFTFHKIGLGGKNEKTDKGWEIKTLGSIMEMLGHTHRVIDLLKVDIEEYEYVAIPEMIHSGVTKQIKQIALETHSWWMREEDRAIYYYRFATLWSLEKNGFKRFSSHPGMYADKMNDLAQINDWFVYELAWFNSKF